ncbi:MurR/RpiR family transcriptional regulator [Paenibacillus turpanensis]|uniref:MurR/RpiR family transcriptional regulator n=1 Tax=Paenibacillus turpanensis TaxID=2689078 RepID=UPI001A9E5B44|nr:MurR/RpiR family transcriptional regulator [Paenibacillus turpanensis]
MIHFDWNVESLSSNQQKIADYIQKNTQRVLYMTEQEIADEVGLSIASVSRFWKAVGFRNLKEVKTFLREHYEVTPANKMKNTINKVNASELPSQLMELSMAHLQETVNHFRQEAFEQAVDSLHTARQIYIYAPGPSEGLGQLMSFRMSRLGLSFRTLPKSGHELYESLLHIGAEDVIVLFGFIRMLPEAKVLLDFAKQTGCRTLLITDRLVSEFSEQADLTLFASRGEVWEFHSMIAPTFIVENLILGIGLKRKDLVLEKLGQLSELRKRYDLQLPR